MQLSRHTPIGEIVRPTSGWLRTLRKTLGLTLAELAQRLKITPPAVRSFEQAEAEDRITLASLRRTAAAMDCELIYLLVPRAGLPLALPESEPPAFRQTQRPSLSRPEVASDLPKKVTDLTWHTLHGES